MRLFVAADLPADARGALSDWGRRLARAGGWRAIAADNLHLTLAFLGWRPDEEDIARIGTVLSAAAGAAAARPIGPITLGAALLLPRRGPRVSAVALEEPSGALVELQAFVSVELAALGVYTPERRAWLPHVTVARRTREPRPPATLDAPAWELGEFHLPAVTVYRSRLARSGAQYEPLVTEPLVG